MSNNTQQIETPATADRPTFTLFSEGQEVSPEYQVRSIVVERAANRIGSATITLLDGEPSSQDFPISNAEDFLPGKEISIQAGYHSEEAVIFKGVVVRQAVRTFEQRSSQLEIHCKDKAVALSIGRKNAYYYELTDSDVIEEILDRVGLAGDVAPTSVTHQEMVQFQATDWDFICSRAEANGMLVYTQGDTVQVAPPDLGQEAAQTLAYGGNLLDVEAEMDARHQYGAVHAYGWNAAEQELLDLEGEPPAGELPGNVAPDDLSGVIGLATYDLRHGGGIKDVELQQQANAFLLKSRLAKVQARVRIQGLGSLRPGQLVKLEGVGDRFTGPFFVAGVQHQINSKNWETQLQLGLSPQWFTCAYDNVTARPASCMLPAVNGLHIGLVTALEGDPEGEDRVQVRIPLINAGEEGVWARVASLDAGENRGAFFRPEIGDEVVLGFLDDDPRTPVILGMMNSSAKPAPIVASDDNHEKGFTTRSELKLIFNDEDVSISLETPNGNTFIISEADGGITLSDENANKVVLNADGITIESAKDLILKASGDVNVEGTNVNLKASANLKAEGGAGAELSTSATAVVKGSMVQIN